VARPFILCSLAALCAVACSADAVEEPLPGLDVPGAFVAVQRDEGGYALLRTRTVLALSPDRTLIFFDEHPPGAESIDEARAKARELDLVLVLGSPRLQSSFSRRPYQVVWYRSLTDEERGSSGF